MSGLFVGSVRKPNYWHYGSIYSQNTPGFRSYVRSGARLPQHTFGYIETESIGLLDSTDYGDSIMTFAFDSISNSGIGTGSHNPFKPPFCGRVLGSKKNYVQEAKNKALTKLRNRPIDIGVALGEYKETSALFANSATKAVELYNAARKHDFRTALRVIRGYAKRPTRVARDAADAWLGLTYGVKPLVSDLEAAYTTLASRSAFTNIDHVSATVLIDDHDYWEYTQNILDAWRYGRFSPYSNYYRFRLSSVGKARCQFNYEVKSPIVATLDKLGLTNPFSLGWELIPFSFVVDWFIPIGEALQSAILPSGFRFVDGSVSTHCSTVINAYKDINRTANPDWGDRRIDSAISRMRDSHREILSEFPAYAFMVPDVSLTLSQVTSAVSLLVQLSSLGKPKKGTK